MFKKIKKVTMTVILSASVLSPSFALAAEDGTWLDNILTIASLRNYSTVRLITDILLYGSVKDAMLAQVLPPYYIITISKAGTGQGTVFSAPEGISCGSTCNSSFEGGSSLTLTAIPSSGSFFVNWGGVCSGSSSQSCTFNMNSNTPAVATFNVTPLEPYYGAPEATTTAGVGVIQTPSISIISTTTPTNISILLKGENFIMGFGSSNEIYVNNWGVTTSSTNGTRIENLSATNTAVLPPFFIDDKKMKEFYENTKIRSMRLMVVNSNGKSNSVSLNLPSRIVGTLTTLRWPTKITVATSTKDGVPYCDTETLQTRAFTVTLYQGLYHPDVKSLQAILVKQGYLPPGTITGRFDEATTRAVENFQEANSIVSYGTPETTGFGLVGARTRAKLNSIIGMSGFAGTSGGGEILNIEKPTFSVNLKQGMYHPEIKILQSFLIGQDYMEPGYITGYFGPLTAAAIEEFQRDNGVLVTAAGKKELGTVGSNTRDELNAFFGYGPNAKVASCEERQ